MNKSTIGIGVVVILALIAAVGGLYYYGQKKMIRDSANQFNAAKTLYETSQWPQAEQLFGEIVRKYPRSDVVPQSLYYMAMLAQSGGNFQESLERWECGSRRLPPYP